MSEHADPFERAVAKEATMRRRAAILDSPMGVISLVSRMFLALAVAWAAILAGHWYLLAEPRWLAVLHTVAFALTLGYALIVGTFLRVLMKRRPDWFEVPGAQ